MVGGNGVSTVLLAAACEKITNWQKYFPETENALAERPKTTPAAPALLSTVWFQRRVGGKTGESPVLETPAIKQEHKEEL